MKDRSAHGGGSPGLTLSELGTGIGLKGGEWVAARRGQRYKNTRHTHTWMAMAPSSSQPLSPSQSVD